MIAQRRREHRLIRQATEQAGRHHLAARHPGIAAALRERFLLFEGDLQREHVLLPALPLHGHGRTGFKEPRDANPPLARYTARILWETKVTLWTAAPATTLLTAV